MPASDTSIPAICRAVGRSCSRASEHRIMKSGNEELMSRPLTAVVVRSPR